jgi:hypothetical protein
VAFCRAGRFARMRTVATCVPDKRTRFVRSSSTIGIAPERDFGPLVIRCSSCESGGMTCRRAKTTRQNLPHWELLAGREQKKATPRDAA